MLAPGEFLIVPLPVEPNRDPPRSTPGEGHEQTPEPPDDDRPQTFLEAVRRMLASIHT